MNIFGKANKVDPRPLDVPVMASEARIATFIVCLYDDEGRKTHEFVGCRNARHENYGVAFDNEMGLKRYYEAPYISFEEQP